MKKGAPGRGGAGKSRAPDYGSQRRGERHASKLAAARKVLDFSVSPELARIVNERACVAARPEISGMDARTIPEMIGAYDFYLAAKERQATIDGWRKRFETRSTRHFLKGRVAWTKIFPPPNLAAGGTVLAAAQSH